jgi:hypothetical protein
VETTGMGGDGDLVCYRKRRGRRAHWEVLVACGGDVDFRRRMNVMQSESGQMGRGEMIRWEKTENDMGTVY